MKIFLNNNKFFNPITVAITLIIFLLFLGNFISPGFASPNQIISLLIVASLLGIISAGQNLVILGGREGIDLSVGGVVSIAAVVAGNVMDGSNAAILPAVVVTLSVGALIGLINGIGVTFIKIPPLVMTLGMLGVLQGLLVVVRNGVPSGNAAPFLVHFATKPFLNTFPGILWLWLIITLFLVFLLKHTVYGLRIYAIGTNERAAKMTAVPVELIRVSLFVLSGMFSALAGICILGYSGSSFANIGEQYILPSIIAVVFGGTSLAGGKGGYVGTALGAILLIILQSILITIRIDESGRQMIFGATLLLLMVFYGRGKMLRS
ncbi:ABC transporter permease [Alphaproteobacteria bacterium]|nr:ABC transporter permease [Alphaproteobacteria bacterium]